MPSHQPYRHTKGTPEGQAAPGVDFPKAYGQSKAAVSVTAGAGGPG